MKRVLIAWEMGANFGHLAQCLRIADALRERGHTVAFVARDIRIAAEILDKAGYAYFQAPIQPKSPKGNRPPVSFAEILALHGYADPWTLQGMTCAWMSIYRLYRPDVILADHAPTALFSARLTDIPALPIGNGFVVPPAMSPMPSIRPDESVPAAVLQRVEDMVNRHLEAVGKRIGSKGATIPTIAGLYDTSPLLSIFKEFDPFEDRPHANYIGPIFGLPNTQIVEWQGKQKHRVFAYLRPEVKGLFNLLKTLRESDIEAIVVSPGLTDKQVKENSAPNLRILTSAINLSNILPQADIAINQGNPTSMAESLLAGTPLLVLSLYVEQYLAARRANALGASIVYRSNKREEEDFATALQQLLTDPSYKRNAVAFAERHSGFDIKSPIQAAVAALEAHA